MNKLFFESIYENKIDTIVGYRIKQYLKSAEMKLKHVMPKKITNAYEK